MKTSEADASYFKYDIYGDLNAPHPHVTDLYKSRPKAGSQPTRKHPKPHEILYSPKHHHTLGDLLSRQDLPAGAKHVMPLIDTTKNDAGCSIGYLCFNRPLIPASKQQGFADNGRAGTPR